MTRPPAACTRTSARSTSARSSGIDERGRDRGARARRSDAAERDRRRSASPSSSTASWPRASRAASAPSSATAASPSWPADGAPASCAPDLGPAEPHPTRRRDPGHRPRRRSSPSTSSSTPPTSRSRARSPPSCARPAAACPACARSGCPRRAGAPRSRPTSTTRSRCRWRRWSSASASWPPSTAPARSRPSWSGWSPAAALEGYPDDVADPRLRPRRARDRGASRAEAAPPRARFPAVAQTKKKRRRKHRGTQGGRIDTAPSAAAPAQPRGGARRGPAPAAQRDRARDAPPTWRSAIDPRPRSPRAIFFVLLVAALRAPARRGARSRRLHARLLHPAGYYMDQLLLQPPPRSERQQIALAQRRTDEPWTSAMFTVGPVAENCFVFRARRAPSAALIVDPGDEAERILAAVEELGRDGRGDPAHPPPLRPHRRRRARSRRRPARPSTARRSRSRCSPTSCPSSPGPASAPSRATRPTRP